jgi:hypothetical protein
LFIGKTKENIDAVNVEKGILLSNFTFISCVPKAKSDAAMQTKEM